MQSLAVLNNHTWLSAPSVPFTLSPHLYPPCGRQGFFDRCFVPGVGFRYNKELGKRETGLQNIQQVGILTTYGFSQAQVAVSGDAGRRMISGGMRMLFASDCTLQHMGMYEMQSADTTHEHRSNFLSDVESSFEKW